MNQYRVLTWAALAGLLLLTVACGPAPTPADVGKAALTPAPTSEPAATVAYTPTVHPSATKAVTATSLPPTEAPPAPSSTPLPLPSTAGQGNADVLHVRAVLAADGSWTFHVTVEHPDAGWQDYADGWDVVLPDGAVLKPDTASPFTR